MDYKSSGTETGRISSSRPNIRAASGISDINGREIYEYDNVEVILENGRRVFGTVQIINNKFLLLVPGTTQLICHLPQPSEPTNLRFCKIS